MSDHHHSRLGEGVELVVGLAATVAAADQAIKLASSRDHHKTGHLVKAGVGAAVAAGAFHMFHKARQENRRLDDEREGYYYDDGYGQRGDSQGASSRRRHHHQQGPARRSSGGRAGSAPDDGYESDYEYYYKSDRDRDRGRALIEDRDRGAGDIEFVTHTSSRPGSERRTVWVDDWDDRKSSYSVPLRRHRSHDDFQNSDYRRSNVW